MTWRGTTEVTKHFLDERGARKTGLTMALVPEVSHAVDLHGRCESLASDILMQSVYQVDAEYGTHLQDVYVNTRSSSHGSSLSTD